MSNKDRNKRSVRKARAEERAVRDAARAASSGSAGTSVAVAKPKAETKPAKAAKSGKPGFFARIRNYFADVRTELHRVVWPSKDELKNYSLAVIVMLLVFGVVIWLVDSGVVAMLIGYTGLRG